MILGLTGQSGAGKSTVASLLASRGFRVIDCDGIVHALSRERQYAEAIANAFGRDYLKDGEVDRWRLGALVFSDRTALDRLNETVRPMILAAVLAELTRATNDGIPAVLDAPLLFEYGLEKACDLTLGVITDTEIAVRRLAARDGKSEAEIRGRLASQHDAEYFRTHCDHTIRNDTDSLTLAKNLDRILKTLTLPI